MTHGEVRTSHIFAMSQVVMEEGQESRGGLVMTRRGSVTFPLLINTYMPILCTNNFFF